MEKIVVGGDLFMINLSQKERMLLEDQKSHEDACVKKYTKYAEEANDPALKQMFLNHANKEQEHYNTLNQILNGQLPNITQEQGQQNQQSASQNVMQSFTSESSCSQKDADLCKDLLMTEKYVSSTYNTTIFECRDTNLRQILNHIQKEEQQHGEDIFNYMQSKGMYNVQ
jgi:spore coat protein CotF